MAARDLYHQACVTALVKDGWKITHDPLMMPFGDRDVLIDIGAERLLAAERNGERIAVEIMSFIGLSPMHDFQAAVGQYVTYDEALTDSATGADRKLYLAVRLETFTDLFRDAAWMKLVRRRRMNLIVFNPETLEVTRWISWSDTDK